MVANSAQTGMVVVSMVVETVVAVVVLVTLVETVVACVFISNSVVVESVDTAETVVECCGSCADF